MKKIFVFLLMLMLTAVILVGCSGEEAANGAGKDEFLGKFSGEAGSLEFLSDGKVKVAFASNYNWMIMSESNNNKIHRYEFITKKNEEVSYDKAEYVNFYKDEGGMIISNPCKVQKDSIVLYPSSINETILDKVNE